MTVNLISLASQYLTPEILTRIASTLGIDKGLIGKACSAALPALFGSFADLASTQDGARKLFGAVSQQNTNVLDNLSHAVGGSGQQGLMDTGLRSLSSLLDSSSISALTGAVGKFAGVGKPVASSILGMLTPVLLGVLGKQSAELGLDSSGISRLLASQKDNIAAAMPSGFKDMLRSGTSKPLGADQTEQRATYTRKVEPSSLGSPLLWVLPAIALGALAWWLLGNRTTDVAEQAKPQTQTAQTHETVAVAGVDLGSTTQKTLDGVKATLQGIKDEASAQVALPKLQSAATELDNVIKLSGQLPAGGKKTLIALVVAAQPATAQLFEKVLAIPSANAVARPEIDALKVKIDTLSKV